MYRTYPNSRMLRLKSDTHQKRFDHKKIYATRAWIHQPKWSQREKVFIAKRCGAQFAGKVTYDTKRAMKKKKTLH